MSSFFRPRSNAIFRSLLGGAVLFVTLAFGGAELFLWSSYNTGVGIVTDQPIPFTHQHHVQYLGIDCRYCHSSVERSAYAGMPDSHTCMTCHSQIWSNSPLLKPVRDSYTNDTPIEWNRVYRLPDFVYFNHSIHVNKGVGCVSCHGQIEQMPLTWKNRPFFMRDCLSCHRNPETEIRPADQIFNFAWKPPVDWSQQYPGLMQKYGIDPKRLVNCNVCHR
jgi:hypothetical protein